MHHRIKKIGHIIRNNQLTELMRYLLKDEAASGKFILLAVVLAILVVNTSGKEGYETFWATNLSIGIGRWVLSQDLLHWLNEGLMSIFFLVVGLEIKREVMKGELRKRQTAYLPIFAAVGGMVVPALIYVAFNLRSDTTGGWAIPTATDIALAIGLLSLLGRRVPSSLKLFLLTLAIVDDIGAILIIALFYSGGIQLTGLLWSALIISLIVNLWRVERLHMSLFLGLGVLLWVAIHSAGIHPSITGAILGFLAPIAPFKSRDYSLAERLERYAIPVSTLVVVPLFAFANTGIHLSLEPLVNVNNTPAVWGIIFGLFLGKVIGVSIASWLAVRTKLARLPKLVSWQQIIGVGFLAGVGFTVSIFITNLSFTNPSTISAAKDAIFIASALSAVMGLATLRFSHVKKEA